MSKRFYNYLSEKILNFFNESQIRQADKFFVQFDEEDKVEKLYNSLKNCAEEHSNFNVLDFEYKHESSNSSFKTFAIEFNNLKVVVANSHDVFMDYLVTLRNQVTDQKDIWKNTSLLVICHNVIDSVYGGMRDLEKEDMPLNIKSIKNNLQNEIKDSKLSKVDKEVTKFYLNKKEEEGFQITLWDYGDVLSIVNKGSIDDSDYSSLGLFYDSMLDTYNTSKQKQNRLQDNYDIHEQVKLFNQYDDKKESLEKMFDSKGVNLLSDDDWDTVDFKEILQSRDKLLQSKKQLNYIENNNKFTNQGDFYWEKPRTYTKAGQRKREIIIFKDKQSNKISLDFKFDNRLKNEYLSKNASKIAKVYGKTLKINFEVKGNEPIFKNVVYKHNNETRSTYSFNILVVQFNEHILESIQSKYIINNKHKRIVVEDDTNEDINFGNGSNESIIEITNKNQEVMLFDEDTIKISRNNSILDEEDSLIFKLNYNNVLLPIEIKEISKPHPVKSLLIWKSKREHEENIVFKGNKATQGVNSFYLENSFKQYLHMEREIIKNHILYGKKDINCNIEKIDLPLSDKLNEKYFKILDYYYNIDDSDFDNVPSLVYLDNELQNLYEDFLNEYNKEIEEIHADSILSNDKSKLNLIKLGTLEEKNRILFSSLSPLNMAYQLEIAKQCRNEVIENNILERLIPNNLLPYLYGKNNLNKEDVLYRPIYQTDAHEWSIYEKSEEVSIGITNAFIANVVKEKINQFVNHFDYLFDKNSAPICLNIININDDKEIIKGIFNFIQDKLLDKNNNMIPVEVNIYNKNSRSSFDEFFSCVTADQLSSKFNIKVKSNKMDPLDIIRLIQENITYYKHDFSSDNPFQKVDFDYAHISFYKVGGSPKTADDNMNQIETGLSIDGLLSSLSSITERSEYRIGFGTKNILNEDNLLIKTAINLNELSLNTENGGENTYKKGKTIITKPMELNNEIMEKLYDTSHWVTFIEPTFGLEFFDKDNKDNLIVIHYSDQYSSSTQYDTITVTNKSYQYKSIIKSFLKNNEIMGDITITDEKLNSIIKIFNSINGEWLLRIIRSFGQYDKEKLSIVSAIKYCLSILDNEDIIWIPISMEEILRIAGTVKLSKNEGIFGSRPLKGKFSDDLLFIGMNIKNPVEVYYYPVEVKIGINKQNIIKKGKEQIDKTYSLLKEQLDDSLNNVSFRNKFFRNFFMQIFLSNEQKLSVNDVWNEKDMDRIREFKSQLLNDDYKISYKLEKLIGKGAIISFKKDNPKRLVYNEDDKLIIELTESDAYYGLLKSIDQINNDIKNDKTDIPTEDLLFSHDISRIKENEDDDVDDVEEVVDVDVDVGSTIINTPDEPIKNDLTNVRALIGKVVDSEHEIYWEYGNKDLANRHLLIQGKSGQGKTYFMQRLIKELSMQNIPTVIIDYTDGFTKSQLEKEFTDYLKDKIQYNIVIRDKIPLNPFRKHKKLIDGDFIDEDNIDVAARFQSVIGSVYNLGIQQLNSIYKAVLKGLDKYGDDMNLEVLEDELTEDGSNTAVTALSQLQVFVDKNPFGGNDDSEWWSFLEENEGIVKIIQLTGFNKDIQKIITELILWDLWNYKLIHGDKEHPFAVVLDESHNLDFSNSSPASKILTEGRKFGWSGWFATQYLKGKMDNNAIGMLQNAEEKIYFNPPDNSIEFIAKSLKSNENKKIWEQRLSNLKKGQCIVYGPRMDEDGDLSASKPIIVNVSPLSESGCDNNETKKYD